MFAAWASAAERRSSREGWIGERIGMRGGDGWGFGGFRLGCEGIGSPC